jgi:hypothetical protein
MIRAAICAVAVLLAAVCTAHSQTSRSRFRLAAEYDDIRLWDLIWVAGEPVPARTFEGPIVVLFGDDGRTASPDGRSTFHECGEAIYLGDRPLTDLGNGPIGKSLMLTVVELRTGPRVDRRPRSDMPPAFPREEATRLMENERVTVWSFVLRPETPTARHAHNYRSVTVWLDDGELEFETRSGATRRPVQRGGIGWESAGGVDAERAVSGPLRGVTLEVK